MAEFDMMYVLELTVLSMSVVFASLLVISFILDLFKIVFKEKEVKTNKSAVSKKSINKTDNGIIIEKENLTKADKIALFTAAIAASNGKKVSNIRIKSIRKVS